MLFLIFPPLYTWFLSPSKTWPPLSITLPGFCDSTLGGRPFLIIVVHQWYSTIFSAVLKYPPLHPSWPCCYVIIPYGKITPRGSLFWKRLLRIYFYWVCGKGFVIFLFTSATMFLYINFTPYSALYQSFGCKEGLCIGKKRYFMTWSEVFRKGLVHVQIMFYSPLTCTTSLP